MLETLETERVVEFWLGSPLSPELLYLLRRFLNSQVYNKKKIFCFIKVLVSVDELPEHSLD